MKNVALNSAEDIISLMELYRSEWKFRSQEFVSYFWRFIYLSLIITFLPNFLNAFDVSADIVNLLPNWIFSIFGVAFSLFGLYFGLAENKRITNLDITYKRIAKALPKDARVSNIDEWYYKPRLNISLCIISYGATTILAVVNAIVT